MAAATPTFHSHSLKSMDDIHRLNKTQLLKGASLPLNDLALANASSLKPSLLLRGRKKNAFCNRGWVGDVNVPKNLQDTKRVRNDSPKVKNQSHL